MKRNRLMFETLESRTLLAADILPPRLLLAMDVTGDGSVSSADALHVINGLNTWGTGDWRGQGGTVANLALLRRLDANNDQTFTPLDALSVINRLNESGPQTIELRDLVGSIVDQLTPEQQTSIEQFFHDLNSIRTEADISGDQILALVENLSGIVGDATAPTREQIDALTTSFLDEIADGELSDADIDQLNGEVQHLLVTLDVDPAKLDELLGEWQAIFDATNLTDGDVDRLLGTVESLVNAFAPGALNLPSANELRGLLDGWIDQVPGWLDNSVVSADNSWGFQQLAASWLDAHRGDQLLDLLSSPALSDELPVLGELNPATAFSLLARWRR